MESSKKTRPKSGAAALLAGLFSLALLLGALFWAFGAAEPWLSDQIAFAPEEVKPVPQEPVFEPGPAADVHPGARLEVENILQQPELPNGCEATSVAIVLNHLGFDADKMEIARDYLPRREFVLGQWGYVNGDPETVYPGNPWRGGSGYYCYPGVVVQTANAYLAEKGAPYAAQDISGADEDALFTLLDAGLPVIVWNTTDGESPVHSTKMKWILDDTDQLYTPYVNLHVSVLTGYDDENLYFADPLGRNAELAREDFFEIYDEMGRRAVVVREGTPVDTRAQSGEGAASLFGAAQEDAKNAAEETAPGALAADYSATQSAGVAGAGAD